MLTSLQNPLVKQLRKLHRTKERREQGISLLEGTHLLQEALAVGCPLLTVCHTESWQERYPSLWSQISTTAQRVEAVSLEVLKAIATTVEPDGIVATITRFTNDLGVNTSRQPIINTLGIAVESLQDPGNLGTLIRTAAAAAADGLWVSADSVELDHPKVMRASAGQWFRLPMGVSQDLGATVQTLKSQGKQIIATLPRAKLSYWQMDLQRPSLILLGNEGAGLSDSLADLADCQVKIPLGPGVESLNVATTAALILYEAQRQRGFNPA